jgi:hypothetical protein
MVQTATEFNNIAAYYAQIAFRDGTGYPMGNDTTPDDVTAADVKNAYLIQGLIDLNPGVATFPVVTNQGGQRVISKTPMPSNDYGAPTFSLSQRDEQLDAYLGSHTLDTSYNAEWMLRAANVAQEDFPSFMMIFSVQATDSTTMQQWWDNYCFYNCRVIKTGEAGAGQVTGDATNPNPFTYTIYPALASRHTSGTSISALSLSVKNNEDAWGYVRADNPLGLTTFIGNGAGTASFALGYRPVSDDATGSAQNNITENGTQDAPTSVSTTTGVVALTGGWTLDAKVVALYETNFVAI